MQFFKDLLYGMTLFDAILVAVVVFSTLLGTLRGLVKELLSLLNWTVAFWLANRYGESFFIHFDWVAQLSSPMKTLLGCASVFFASMMVGAVLTGLMSRVVTAAGLGFADGGLGALFGATRGVLIVLVMVTAAGFTSLPETSFWRDAKLSSVAVDGVRVMKSHLPEAMAKQIRY